MRKYLNAVRGAYRLLNPGAKILLISGALFCALYFFGALFCNTAAGVWLNYYEMISLRDELVSGMKTCFGLFSLSAVVMQYVFGQPCDNL